MGIADAGMDMRLPSAAPATKLMARAFMGHLLLLRSRNKPATPALARMVSRMPARRWSRSVEEVHRESCDACGPTEPQARLSELTINSLLLSRKPRMTPPA